jgi:hypothetical protein
MALSFLLSIRVGGMDFRSPNDDSIQEVRSSKKAKGTREMPYNNRPRGDDTKTLASLPNHLLRSMLNSDDLRSLALTDRKWYHRLEGANLSNAREALELVKEDIDNLHRIKNKELKDKDGELYNLALLNSPKFMTKVLEFYIKIENELRFGTEPVLEILQCAGKYVLDDEYFISTALKPLIEDEEDYEIRVFIFDKMGPTCQQDYKFIFDLSEEYENLLAMSTIERYKTRYLNNPEFVVRFLEYYKYADDELLGILQRVGPNVLDSKKFVTRMLKLAKKYEGLITLIFQKLGNSVFNDVGFMLDLSKTNYDNLCAMSTIERYKTKYLNDPEFVVRFLEWYEFADDQLLGILQRVGANVLDSKKFVTRMLELTMDKGLITLIFQKLGKSVFNDVGFMLDLSKTNYDNLCAMSTIERYETKYLNNPEFMLQIVDAYLKRHDDVAMIGILQRVGQDVLKSKEFFALVTGWGNEAVISLMLKQMGDPRFEDRNYIREICFRSIPVTIFKGTVN